MKGSKVFSALLILVALLVQPVLFANGGSDAPAESSSSMAADEPVELVVQVEPTWVDYYMGVADRVMAEYPNATISWIETGAFDHLDVLDSTDAGNPDVADVYAFPLDRLFGLVQNQALSALDAQAMASSVGGFGNYDAGLGGALNVDGEYFGFPMNIETLVIFANAANAAAAGYSLDGTFEFTELNPEDFLVPVWNAWFGVALLNSAEIELLGKTADGTLFSDLTADFEDLDADKQAVFQALFDYWQAHNAANTPLWDNSAAWGYMDTAFTSGNQTTMRLEGPWSTFALSNLTNEGADLEILPIDAVTLNGNPLAHWQSGWAVGANARIEEDAAKMEIAQAFIAEISNPMYAADFFGEPSKIMANVPASDYEAMTELSETDRSVIAAVVDSYENAATRPLFIEWGQVWGTWENSVLSWAAVQPSNVEEAYAEVQAAFTAMMQNF